MAAGPGVFPGAWQRRWDKGDPLAGGRAKTTSAAATRQATVEAGRWQQ